MSEPVIGIDLGTTYSAVATVEEGRPRLIPNRAGGRLTPSMVGFRSDGDRVVGEAARVLLEESPESVAFATKRFIGRRWTQELAEEARSLVPYPLVQGSSGEVRVKIAERVLPLPQVGAMILGELKLDAQTYFGRPVTKAVITVPANFDDGQRQATKEAATIAGLEVLRIVNEPTAAAVAYGLTNKFEGRALVFDLGGGTFDVSILEVEDGVFEVKATGGDPALGGEDFDNRVMLWLLAQIPPPLHDVVARDQVSLAKLKTAAERAKRQLTVAEEVYISITELGDHVNAGGFTELSTALTRSFFESLSQPLTRRCVDLCRRVLVEAQLEPSAIDAVLLVGGMTRVPLVRKLVTEYFGKEPVGGLNPDEVVALGAAVHAHELAEQGGASLLLDVASHSLGVGMLGGRVRRLIQKNTSIPVAARELFVPGRSGQTEARITVFQGENDFCEENAKLGEVVLRDLNVTYRGDTPIEVLFELSSDGTLSVRATDTTTGLAQAIRIEARTELSQPEVERLRQEQVEYAAVRLKKDQAVAHESFKHLLEKGEKLARLLQQSAVENPSEEAQAAVSSVLSLLELGRDALAANNAEQMAEITRRLGRITSAQR